MIGAGEVFSWPIRVYWEDTDASGVTYHANYLRWFERARTEWLRSKGFYQDTLCRELGIAFTVSRIEIRYFKPARLDDALDARVAVKARRRASLEFSQQLLRTDGDVLLAEAEVKVACVDAETFRPRAMPDFGL